MATLIYWKLNYIKNNRNLSPINTYNIIRTGDSLSRRAEEKEMERTVIAGVHNVHCYLKSQCTTSTLYTPQCPSSTMYTNTECTSFYNVQRPS